MESSSTAANAPSQPPCLVREQVSLLYGSIPAALVANAFVAAVLAVVQWDVVVVDEAWTWLAVMAVVLVLRAALALHFFRHRDRPQPSAETWLWRFRWGAVATGGAWGLSGILMFPAGQLAHEVFLAFVLAGVSAAAVTSLSADRWSALGFVAPALLPMIVAFFREGGSMAVAMGLMGSAYLVLIAGNAIRLQRRLVENVRLRVEAVERRGALADQQRLMEVIARAQSEFIREPDRRRAFDGLLADVLELTGSEYGFIGEVLRRAENVPYLKTYAITDIAWDDETRAFYASNAPAGLEFTNLETLFGAALKTGQPVIANNPAHDPRRGGLPHGHPALNAFLGIPVFRGGEMVAMLGLANRPGGYGEELLEFLHPLLVTLGQLVEAARVQQKHIESERRLRGIIEGTRIGTWEWNVQSGETVFNERWAEIVGYTLDELAPANIDTWTNLAHPDDLKVSAELLEQHFAGNLDYYDCQCRMRHKDGHWVWVHDRGRVVSWAEDGKPLLMAGTHADITEQKRAQSALQEQAQHTRAIVENMVDGIITINPEGIIESFNPAAERIFGYAADEVIGHNVSMLMPSPFAQMHDRYIRNYRETGVAKVIGIGRELEGQRRDGSLFPVELAISEITRHGMPMYIGMVRDITERKRVDRMKSEFVSTVSHELRTPLTSISGALEIVAQGALGEVPERAREMIDIARRNSERLSHLINDLLDIEKLAAGKMQFDLQVQPLVPLVQQAIEIHRGYGAEHNVAIEFHGEAAGADVRVDQQRFMQVLSNLLSNAIKYSHENGVVAVTVTPRDDKVRITVTDHGPGVPAAFRAHIFQKFAQADASDTRRQGGTGLGLAITRELLEQMGGSIDFDSVEGEGASFYFELPVVTEPVSPSRKPEHADARVVLLVESDERARSALVAALGQSGFRVDVASAGSEAIQRMSEHPYDAVILDLLLADGRGFDVIHHLCRPGKATGIPLLAISGPGDDGQFAVTTDFSDVQWLSKPVDGPQLGGLVAGLVAGTRTARPRLLHVEDDVVLGRVLREVLAGQADVDQVCSLDDARARVALERFDAVVLDLQLSDGSGWELLAEIRARQPEANVIVLSGKDIGLEETKRLMPALLHTRMTPRRVADTLHRSIDPAVSEKVTA
jgi:PAS domain S-box-containing protein